MIEPVRCVIVRCDPCRTLAEVDDTIVHFDRADLAAAELAAAGWRFEATGHAMCPTCAAKQDCAAHGHRWGRWRPCGCRGDVLDHVRRWLTPGAVATGDCPATTRWCDRCEISQATTATTTATTGTTTEDPA